MENGYPAAVSLPEEQSRFTAAAVFYGSLWGITEATLGYFLHLMSRTVQGGSIAGFVMFPFGVFFMISTLRVTGRPADMILTSATAALVKVSSALSPSIPWIFVANPALAILSQGLVVFGAVALSGESRSLRGALKAAQVSIIWRLAFLALVALLPVQKGIFLKGAGTLFRFLVLESAVNALLVPLFLLAREKIPAGASLRSESSGIAKACTLFFACLAVQVLFT